VSLRVRLALTAGAIALSGCGDAGTGGPLRYNPTPALAKELQDKPKLQARVVELVEQMYGPDTDHMRVPPAAPLRSGGVFLAQRAVVGEDSFDAEARPVREAQYDPGRGQTLARRIRGGHAIYREQCMHCHGASGDGDGPTAPFLWPPPRDYRQGIFKFTSTNESGRLSKPTRDDLRRTLHKGILNTSMPAFEAILTDDEIEQVLDYVMFLSMRGETEIGLIGEASLYDDADAETEVTAETTEGVASGIFGLWAEADAKAIDPKVPRKPVTRESILHGRQLFLGDKGLQCAGCHGLDGKGNGDSFVSYDLFKQYVLDRNPDPENVAELARIADEQQKKWGDDWGDPLRPANLTKGEYKGGRRPIDIYWRIAKGINGTPMPGHLGTVTDEEVWDLVNFVLALPYEPELLEGAKPYVPPAGTPPAPTVTQAGG
jgi:mono/diheme cytochrome c family protein